MNLPQGRGTVHQPEIFSPTSGRISTCDKLGGEGKWKTIWCNNFNPLLSVQRKSDTGSYGFEVKNVPLEGTSLKVKEQIK